MHLCIANAAQLVSDLSIYRYRLYEPSPRFSCQSEMPSPLTSPQDAQSGRDSPKPWEQGAHIFTCIPSPDWLGFTTFPSILWK